VSLAVLRALLPARVRAPVLRLLLLPLRRRARRCRA